MRSKRLIRPLPSGKGGQVSVDSEAMLKTETSKPRLAGAVLCGVAAVLLLLCSFHMFVGEAGGRGPGLLLLVVGAGLALAAVKSFRERGRLG